MKKISTVLFVLCLTCVTVAGCARPKSYPEATSNPTSSIITDKDSAVPAPKSENEAGQTPPAQIIGDDVDLTAMSSTMVYAVVYNMMVSPNDYVGRTIKMNGPYYAYYSEKTDQYYHYVIIEDATACCQQGLEFVWTGGHSYPDDYPDDNSRIEVSGVFGSYEELGMTYYHLAVDDVTVL